MAAGPEPRGFLDGVTDINSVRQYPIGTIRRENGQVYKYQQADDTITAGQVLKYDWAASATGKKVTPTAAATDACCGASPIAVTDEYYFWMLVEGIADLLIADATNAGEILAPSGAAGVLAIAPTSTARRVEVGECGLANASGAAALRTVAFKAAS